MTSEETSPVEGLPESALSRWQLFLANATLAAAGACSGVILWESLFPRFYYMVWIFAVIMLWGVIALAVLLQSLILLLAAYAKHVELSSLPRNLGFIVAMLTVVSLLVGFKLPLRASFLLAKPGLEQALADHQEDLAQVTRGSYSFGLYRFSKADRRCHKKDRIFFQFAGDAEAAIIYSQSGIEDLCYNSGNKGHLLGNWYWMKED